MAVDPNAEVSMYIEPSGVVFTGVCDIQTPVCRAREPAALTAVWGSPRIQINVCGSCLNEMIRRGEWERSHVRIPRRYDVAVYSPPGELSVIVQVQTNAPSDPAEASVWARRVHRNLRMAAAIAPAPFFFLVGYPEHLFLWRNPTALDVFAEPTDALHGADVLGSFGDPPGGPAPNARALAAEQAVAAWLETLASASDLPGDAASQWVARTGLLDAIRGGTVVRKPALAA
jgi:hypothetical protein